MLPKQLERVLERNYKNIGTLPTVVSNLIRILNDPKSSTKDLAKVITADKVLSTRLLKMVNSSYFGLRNDVIDINQAISIVGYNVIRSFTFCVTLFDSAFPPGTSFKKEDFWIHSLAVGACAKRIAVKYNLPNQEEYFVAGLVHDIGKVFMYQFLPDTFFNIIKVVEDQNCPFYNVERNILQSDHAEIGAWIMEKWKLPEMLLQSIRFHHYHMFQGETQAVPSQIIGLSDNIVKELQIGSSGDNIPANDYSLLKKKYRITDEWIRKQCEPLQQDVAAFEDIIIKKQANPTGG